MDNHASRNAESTERIRSVVAQLSDKDLNRSLRGGWTVGFALIHLAFWDARQVAALQCFKDGEAFPSEDYATNATLAAMASAFDLAVAGQAAVNAAQELDTMVESLTDEQLTALQDSGKSYAIDRAPHRDEHLQQIEEALG